jgi:hypothetical protein
MDGPDLRTFYICRACGTHRCLQSVEPGHRLRKVCDSKLAEPNWVKTPKESAFHIEAPDLFKKPKGIEDYEVA